MSATYVRRDVPRNDCETSSIETGLDGKGPTVYTEAVGEERETRPASHIRWGDAMLDTCIAILPLYFVAFAIAAYMRDGTLMSSFRNVAILQMRQFNPTIFTIVFTLILAKFIKAVANYRLERGATVGNIQHLLGSRSLVNAIFTPFKLRMISLLVPCLVMIWALNPVGGQLSLRVVSRESNITTIGTDVFYANPSALFETRYMNDEEGRNPSTDRFIENVFSTALMTTVNSKNGTQDVFGNIQIPMIEYLMHNGALTDMDGWFYTMDQNTSGFEGAAMHAAGVPQRIQPIYASILGLPFTAVSSVDSLPSNESGIVSSATIHQIKRDLFGSDTVNTRSNFTMQTSYMYTNCTTKPLMKGSVMTRNSSEEYHDIFSSQRSQRVFPNRTVGVADSGHGFAIAYQQSHNSSSVSARNVTLRSWLGLNNDDAELNGTGFSEGVEVISEASCRLTTTYVEAQVLCVAPANCSVAKIRISKLKDNPSPQASVLDGLTLDPIESHWDHGPASWEEAQSYSDIRGNYSRKVAETFFSDFVNATAVDGLDSTNLSPLESYFANPVAPFRASDGGGKDGGGSGDNRSQRPVTEVGDQLFSWRLSQLLNTYWLSAIIPQTLVSGLDIEEWRDSEDRNETMLPRTSGEIYVETKVLRCHKPYVAVLLVISLGLFILGLTTAYLDATRRGPDVLDDFVNSLRHSPYVHVDTLGPSMQDGQEVARRLRDTVVRMGDVCPNDHHGYVAIGTPHPNQPIERLDRRREYL